MAYEDPRTFQRLKTIDGSGAITRYYEVEEDAVAKCNFFYQVIDNKARPIESTVTTSGIVGFSHGGGNLDNYVDGKDCVLLDINTSVVYMQRLIEEDADKPDIGDLVDGFKRVIAVHYKGDESSEFTTDNLVESDEDIEYFLFTIEQPKAE